MGRGSAAPFCLLAFGGAVRGEKPELEDEVGLGRIADQRVIAGGFERGIELRVGAIGVAA